MLRDLSSVQLTLLCPFIQVFINVTISSSQDLVMLQLSISNEECKSKSASHHLPSEAHDLSNPRNLLVTQHWDVSSQAIDTYLPSFYPIVETISNHPDV